jgi:hypothetical protein
MYLSLGYTIDYAQRVLILLIFIYTIFNAVLFLFIGEKLKSCNSKFIYMPIALTIGSFIFSFPIMYEKINVAKLYSNQFDLRLISINEKIKSNNSNELILKKLPPSGFLNNADISPKSVTAWQWPNDCFCEYYNYKIKIYREE